MSWAVWSVSVCDVDILCWSLSRCCIDPWLGSSDGNSLLLNDANRFKGEIIMCSACVRCHSWALLMTQESGQTRRLGWKASRPPLTSISINKYLILTPHSLYWVFNFNNSIQEFRIDLHQQFFLLSGLQLIARKLMLLDTAIMNFRDFSKIFIEDSWNFIDFSNSKYLHNKRRVQICLTWNSRTCQYLDIDTELNFLFLKTSVRTGDSLVSTMSVFYHLSYN